MKNFTFTMIAMLISTSITKAQITITSSAFQNMQGVQLTSIDTLPNNSTIDIGGTGYQEWDFSSLETHFVDNTVITDDPASTPYGSNYPDADFAGYSNQSGYYSYISVDNNSLDLIGVVANSPDFGSIAFDFTEPATAINFPMNYLDEIQDSSRYQLVIGGFYEIVSASNYNKTVDAYGEITTPYGTFQALRVFSTETTVDSSFIFDGVNWNFDGTETQVEHTYEWWSNYSTRPICSFKYDIIGDSIVYEISFFQADPTASVEGLKDDLITVYPNPTRDYIFIDGQNQEIVNVEMFDATGKMMFTQSGLNPKLSIDLSAFESGIYLMNIETAEGIITKRIVKK